MNYAHGSQPVLESLGHENVGRLEAIRQKYDPENVLRKYWPGGFKL